MATLILEQDGERRGAVLNGRTVIGRRANSHILIADRSVSRVHAWIGRAGRTFFVADSGSRTGTRVNGRKVEGRRTLRDGDQISIGPATITFSAAAALPPDIEPLLRPSESGSEEDGIFVSCECGAPIWAPWDYGGRTARCRQCGALLKLPRPPEAAEPSDPGNDTIAGGLPSSPAPAASGVDMVCGACQSPISTLEATTTCLDCGVAFHADCWTENRGCSSYGCKQVGVLDAPPPKPARSAVLDQIDATIEEPDGIWGRFRGVSWDQLLLPGSGLIGLVGVFAFGVPSVAIVAGLVVWSLRRRPKDPKHLAAATILSAVMAAVGSAVSTYWWFMP